MKKIVSFFVALMIIATMSVAVFADNANGEEGAQNTPAPATEESPTPTPTPEATPNYDSTQTVTVYTKIDPSFTVTIPATVSIDYKSTSKSFDVVLSETSMLDKNYFIDVKVSSANNYALVNSVAGVGYELSDSIPYSLSYKNYYETGVYSTTFNYLYNPGQVLEYTISIAPTAWNSIHSGYYSDTLTFDLKYTHTDSIG